MSSASGKPATSSRGKFIVFEGADGTGKSTQAALLANRLDALLTREPGGTEIGQQLRGILLSPDNAELSPRAEALLMAADRAQHVEEAIAPTLRAGRNVVSDRYVGSSLAYQGVGRGLGIDAIREVNAFATDGLQADLVILLDVDESVAYKRVGRERDRIESSGFELAQSVAGAYRELATQDPSTWVTVDASGSVDAVAGRVWDVVNDRIVLS